MPQRQEGACYSLDAGAEQSDAGDVVGYPGPAQRQSRGDLIEHVAHPERLEGPLVTVRTLTGVTEFGWIVGVEAMNKGRGDAQVVSWGLLLPDDGRQVLFLNANRWSPQVPCRIEAAHQLSWIVPLPDLQHVAAKFTSKSLHLCGFVRLGNGDEIVGSGVEIDREAILNEERATWP